MATGNREMAPMSAKQTPAPTMNRIEIDRFIVDCPSFEDFRQRIAPLSNKDKGDITERLAQVYLQTAPEYRTARE